mgnify:CR=1 FL=1
MDWAEDKIQSLIPMVQLLYSSAKLTLDFMVNDVYNVLRTLYTSFTNIMGLK